MPFLRISNIYFVDLLICNIFFPVSWPDLQRSLLYTAVSLPCFVAVPRTACSQGGENINDTGIYLFWCGMKFHAVEITTALYQNKTSGNAS